MTSLVPSRPFVLLLFLVCVAALLSRQPYFDRSHAHRITYADIRATQILPRLNFSRSHHEFYASEAARSLCDAHGYSVFKPRSDALDGRRKIYDLFMVNTELDFLEIRLKTLYNYIDYFVIVEAPLTFQGGPKNLTIHDNWKRFEAYHDKMIYHQLQYPKGFKPLRHWDREDLQRNAMFEQVFPKLTGEQTPARGDVILVADVDEVPRPATMLVLRTCNFPRRLTLSSKFYYYSFQFLHDGPEWPFPQATYYQGMRKTILPGNLRTGDAGIPLLRDLEKGVLSNAGWHCSSCFATVDQFLNKMASFSHAWMNRDSFRDRDRIANAVRQGVDLWGRKVDTFTRVDNNLDLPRCLLEDRERFRYILDRDGETAGFTDYP
ncbi:hypothetical protein FGSG_05624 [Fusarium graminearum PH-1]|uniref:Chromosome 3, complete genome n=1 Tax=Gibberella zeae (strain ATCC MYA-4620 / CBS 123657 / FGSC 9075 / NRRL 31084 / PH-1) TaxID=229533 RepID=I1RNP0_GIBZE|nr:hypothetical protein FGSG_05624 [Fusarium graminearum PH-1]ESU11610.1 hypothetical protein FGSG_05624 [Fusarium graminearum PH-1]CEF88474.1 unnamed protein product [Fusarium graminearum]|eukprot:XP_011324186.1 hypothetical protein FGSG_05624 [Fusarium graminearum PH-1]